MSRKTREKNGAAVERILDVLRALGQADDHRHIAIRTDELVARAGVDRHNLGRIVQPLIESGQVLVCKVTNPGVTRGTPQNEYRLAAMVQPAFVPLKTGRHGIAHGAFTKPLPVTTPAPKVSTPKPGVHEIEVPVLGRAQPAGDVPPRPQRINDNDGIALRIDHDGTLLIATDEGVLEIDPKQSRRLGHFMADTHGVWNPF